MKHKSFKALTTYKPRNVYISYLLDLDFGNFAIRLLVHVDMRVNLSLVKKVIFDWLVAFQQTIGLSSNLRLLHISSFLDREVCPIQIRFSCASPIPPF